MDREKLLDLVNGMTLTEKAMQMTQLAHGLVFHTQLTNLTGPFREWSFTEEELKMTGSILGTHGAQWIIKLQKEFLEKSEKKIPLIFMEDIIHGFSTVFPIPLAQGCSFDLGLIEEAAYVAAKEASVSGIHVSMQNQYKS